MKETEYKTYFRYWGKAEKDGSGYHLLPYHCLDVAAVGAMLLKQNTLLSKKISEITGFDEKTSQYWILMFLGLHDIGKFSVTFQGLREDLINRLHGKGTSRRYTVRHDSLGHLLWKDEVWRSSILPEMESEIEYWQAILDIFSKAFSGHHGKPPSLQGKNDVRLRLQNFFEESDKAAALSFFNDLKTLFIQQYSPALNMISPLDLHDRIKQASWFLAGFVVLCDWIGSNVEWFRFKETPIPLDEYWEKYALPQAEAAVRKAGVGHVWQVNEGISFNGCYFSD